MDTRWFSHMIGLRLRRPFLACCRLSLFTRLLSYLRRLMRVPWSSRFRPVVLRFILSRLGLTLLLFSFRMAGSCSPSGRLLITMHTMTYVLMSSVYLSWYWISMPNLRLPSISGYLSYSGSHKAYRKFKN